MDKNTNELGKYDRASTTDDEFWHDVRALRGANTHETLLALYVMTFDTLMCQKLRFAAMHDSTVEGMALYHRMIKLNEVYRRLLHAEDTGTYRR